MSRKVAPVLVVNRIDKKENQNSSFGSINNSYLHEGYTGNEETGAKCHYCQKAGKGSLMSACECFGKLYHSECLKKWLGKQMQSSSNSVKSEDTSHQVECPTCGYQIKFKAVTKTRCRNKGEVCSHCSSHKGLTFGLVFLFTVITACLVYLALVGLGVIPVYGLQLAKPTLMIALAVIAFFLLLIGVCCLLDCLRVPDYKIETLYDRNGCSRRSSRSGKSAQSIRSKTSTRNKIKI